MSGRAERSRRPTRVGEALEHYLARSGLAERIEEAGAVPDWEQRVGQRIAAVTRPLTVSAGVLFVAVRSSAWLMELKLMQSEILRRINAGRRHGHIDAVRFVMDEGEIGGAPGGHTGGRKG